MAKRSNDSKFHWDAMPEPIWHLADDGTLLAKNSAACALESKATNHFFKDVRPSRQLSAHLKKLKASKRPLRHIPFGNKTNPGFLSLYWNDDQSILMHWQPVDASDNSLKTSIQQFEIQQSDQELALRENRLARLLNSISRLSIVNDIQSKIEIAADELQKFELFREVAILYYPDRLRIAYSGTVTSERQRKVNIDRLLSDPLLQGNVLTELEAILDRKASDVSTLRIEPNDPNSEALLDFLDSLRLSGKSSPGWLENGCAVLPVYNRTGVRIGAVLLSEPLAAWNVSIEQIPVIELFLRLVVNQLEQLRLLQHAISSEQRYHALIDQLHEGVIVADDEGNIVIVNPATVKLTKYSIEELLGKNELFLFPESEHEKIKHATNERRRRLASTYEAQMLRCDGQLRTVVISAAPLLDERQRYNGSLALLTDVTERRANEAALKQANEELAATNRFANALATKLSGPSFTRKMLPDLLGKLGKRLPESKLLPDTVNHGTITAKSLEADALDLVMETAKVETGAIFQCHSEPGRAQLLTYRYRNDTTEAEDEITTIVEWLYPFAHNETGQFYCEDIAAFTEIGSEQKKRLREQGVCSFVVFSLAARNQRIGYLFVSHTQPFHFSQSQLQLLRSMSEQLSLAMDNSRLLHAVLRSSSDWARTFDAMPDPVFVLNSDGTIRRSNVSASELCKRDVREIVGKPVSELLGQFGSRLMELPSDIVELEETHAVVGVNRTFAITISPLSSNDRLVVLRDVTERRFLQEQMYEAQRRELVVRFAGGIAHDFNNLLVGIVGTADVLMIKLGLDGENGELLKILQDSSRRAKDLVKQLLAYARGGATQISAVKVNAIIREVQKLLHVTLPPDVIIELDLDPQLPMVMMDETQLQQIVMNLGINANEAMQGRGRIKFITSVGNPPVESGIGGFFEEAVWIRVCDNGPGFPVKILNRPGEPFNSTKGTGRGLGMAAVFGIVARHNGKIMLSNLPEGGACVDIWFPRADEPEPELREPTRKEPIGARRLDGKKILIVDDEPMVRNLVREVLEMFGCEVSEAADGEAGLRVLRSSPFDMVILDIIMPKLGGVEAFREMRVLYPELPVLFVSGYDESDSVARLSDADVYFLQKPFLVNDLFQFVSQAITKT